MKYKAITSFERDGATFVRVADRFGFYFERNGETYGNWLSDEKENFTDEDIDKNWEFLYKNYLDTVKKLQT